MSSNLMSQAEIQRKREDIEERLRHHDAHRKIIEAEKKALQHICEHPNLEKWTDSGWGRMPSQEEKCPDCGYRKSY